jgi:protease-4
MGLLINGIANLSIFLGNLLRRLRRPPRFVSLPVGGPLPLFEPPRAGFLRRRLNPRREGPGLETLRERLERIRHDGRVGGVILRVEDLQAGWATLEELRSELGRFREGGGRVVVYLLDGSDRSLYLASAADEVYAPPLLSFETGGPRARVNFLKDALARFGLRAEVLAVSPYKSAGDTLARSDFSRESREQIQRLLAGRLERLVDALAAGRGLSPEGVRALLLRHPMLSAREAREVGLIDAVIYEDELAGRLGDDGSVRIAEWDAAKRALKRPYRRRAKKVVAVVEVKGTIVRGRGRRLPVPLPLLGGEQAGSESVISALRTAEANRRVGAVLLHVDSPGGDAFASDVIWREVERIQARKPVVVLMGNAAASGGYYVSAPASRVFAREGTVTGSIGVVLTRPVAENLLDRLGVNARTVGPGAGTDLFDVRHEPSPEELAELEKRLDETYEEFKVRVREGRGIGPGELDKIAGGRVWSGAEARERGLVDEIGGLREAFDAARELAGIKEAGLHALVKVRPPKERPSPGEPAREAAEALGAALRDLGSVRVWAMSPYDFGEENG